MALDPLDAHRVYVSERGANRVLALDLDSRQRKSIVVRDASGQPSELSEPGALALEGRGRRMLIVTAAPGGGEQLVGVDVGALGGNVSFVLGGARPGAIASVACGADGLRLAAVPSENELLVAGGMEQRRTIVALDPQSPPAARAQVAVVDAPFDPPPPPGQPWRIPLGSRITGTPEGAVARFAWDSADAQSGRIGVRAIGRDDERGPVAEAAASKRVRSGLEVEPSLTSGIHQSDFVASGDLDGDGDLDIASASRDGMALYFQDTPGAFGAPTYLPEPGAAVTCAPSGTRLSIGAGTYAEAQLTISNPVVLAAPVGAVRIE